MAQTIFPVVEYPVQFRVTWRSGALQEIWNAHSCIDLSEVIGVQKIADDKLMVALRGIAEMFELHTEYEAFVRDWMRARTLTP
jgi:hypothetical protein